MGGTGTIIAIVVMLLSALTYAVSFVLQHKGTQAVVAASESAGGSGGMGKLVTNKIWVIGVLLMVVLGSLPPVRLVSQPGAPTENVCSSPTLTFRMQSTLSESISPTLVERITPTLVDSDMPTTVLELWPIITGLIVGGVIAAPFAALAAKHVPDKPLMLIVGLITYRLVKPALAAYHRRQRDEDSQADTFTAAESDEPR